MLGRAAIAMWWDVPPETNAEFEDWHTHEHMPERLAIPGFLRGTRWTALSGEPSYFILYEAARLAAITAGPYLERLNDPTPWSRKMMPHHLNMVRSLCRVRASFGGGIPHAMATIRFTPPSRGRGSLFKWLAAEALPPIPRRTGLACAHLLEAHDPAAPGPTTEQRNRGGDGTAGAVLLIGGYDAEAVKAVVENELGDLPGRIAGFYRPAFSLVSRDRP